MTPHSYFRQYTAQLFGLSLALVAAACSDNLEFRELPSSEYVTFHATMRADSLRAESRSSVSNVAVLEEEWSLTADGGDDSGASRATLATALSGNAGVVAFEYDDAAAKTKVIDSKDYSFSGDMLTNTDSPYKWSSVTMGKLDVYAYAPTDAVTLGSTVAGVPTVKYTVNDDISKQQDLIVANATVADVRANNNKAVNLNFRHALTAIRFKVGFECTVKSLTLSGVYKTGEYSVWDDTGNGNWHIASDAAADGSYSVSFDSGKTVGVNDYVIDGDNTLILMPQVLPDGAKLTLELGDGTSLEIPMAHFVWRPGMLITYTIYKDKAPAYIYFDLAAGIVDIRATTYKGYRFPVGDEQPTDTEKGVIEVTGNRTSTDHYYVYQSSLNADGTRNGSYDASTGTFTRPVYGDIKVGEKSWKEYITNNNNVEAVIDNWETAATAAGMKASDYYISVLSCGTTCNLTIDNIFSKYEPTPGHDVTRTQAGICFNLTANDRNTNLVINIAGDNRLGAVHYNNIWLANNNKLIFKGNGSLTVADPQGHESNFWNSAIGYNDNGSTCYGIQIDGGIIFAGTKQGENCTAIGAGGNGEGEVTINGGVVTAVASTTGTAIGGGIGYSARGGSGKVTINGGTVYAYNLDNGYDVPSSAIGGAGSYHDYGAAGEVIITGGTVYAYSELGTAIGGGSSAVRSGGDATINISGGNVTAVTGAVGSCSIGGGTGCSRGKRSDTYPDDACYGGSATVNVSDNAVIRTGSMGGGNTNDPGPSGGAVGEKGKIGSAYITITGGTTQAQFIMAAGAKGDAPTFNMTGGTVIGIADVGQFMRTKDVGGAVYIEDGICTLGGSAVIKDCTATHGGAVYIQGGTCNMEGGTIQDCMSTGSGGAIYMIDGKVSLTGGTIQRNLAYGGNGGGVYISGGDFTMNGAVNMTENSAVNKADTGGYGGAVYVTSERDVNVDLLVGQITKNTSEKRGGGVCVRMGSGSTSTALVTVGTKADGDEQNPVISGNHALLQGGGLYVGGTNARTIINTGIISGNTVTAHVLNPDVSNEGGLVKLEGGTVTHSIITFHANYPGATPEVATSKIVTATNSQLVVPDDAEFIRTGYRLDSWNTKADGSGNSYTNGAIIYVESDTDLYAQWQ